MKLENAWKFELLGAGEPWIYHNKDIFFPRSSAATCTNRPLEADQRVLLASLLVIPFLVSVCVILGLT
ncbi:hypothetical protein Taro_026550 [Colocasia esculenta]|uniref:Uncharacterized protein n=1 Tax=Colocasia esculenta TaxID=4460 RepID=A0A843VNX8_COLES|nr:hypothetical protein [Colocasia esculenta]